MRKIIAYLAVSLDGYIATSKDEVDWLYDVPTVGDAGFSDFYQSVDTVILGYRTYDWILNQIKPYPYLDKKNYLVTNRTLNDENITIITDLKKLVKTLKSENGKDVWVVGGGILISKMIELKLIDELRITLTPIILGSGIALFNDLKSTYQLELLRSKTYGQFIELNYKFIYEDQ